MGESAAAVGRGVQGCFGTGCSTRVESCTAATGDAAALWGHSVLHAPHAVQRGADCRSCASSFWAAGLTMLIVACAERGRCEDRCAGSLLEGFPDFRRGWTSFCGDNGMVHESEFRSFKTLFSVDGCSINSA